MPETQQYPCAVTIISTDEPFVPVTSAPVGLPGLAPRQDRWLNVVKGRCRLMKCKLNGAEHVDARRFWGNFEAKAVADAARTPADEAKIAAELSRPLPPTAQGGLARAPISAMPVSAAQATRAEALTLHPASSITNTPAQVAAHRLRLSQARSAASSSSAAGTIAEITPGEFVVIQTTGAGSTLVLVGGTVPPGADSKLPTTKLAVRWWTWVSAKQTYVPWLKAGRQERTEELRASVALTGVTATPGSKLKGPLKKQWLKLTPESRLALAEIAEKAGSDSSGSSGDEGSDEDEEGSEST